ncbi:DUF58 domain-containing protein [bacterium]|nr:DUF58 domain-containing protein [bacterium]
MDPEKITGCYMKLNKDVIQRIKQIELHTRRLLSGSMIGDYSSAKKGSGLEFDQIREYQIGDDIRFIDWSSSARSNKILVKQYIEERNRTVLLLVDKSASTFYGSTDLLKSQVIADIAAVLALVADYGKDHVGAMLFADEVIKSIPAQRGRKHVHMLMENIFLSESTGKTSLNSALKKVLAAHLQTSMIFIISDFIDTDYEKLLKIVARHHDVVAIRCTDQREHNFAMNGFITVQDTETKEYAEIALHDKKLNLFLKTEHIKAADRLKRCGVDLLDVAVDQPFIGQVVRFFRRRMSY